MLPRPERDIVEASKKRVRPEPEVRRARSLRHRGSDDGGDGGSGDEGDDLDTDEAEAIGPGEPETKH